MLFKIILILAIVAFAKGTFLHNHLHPAATILRTIHPIAIERQTLHAVETSSADEPDLHPQYNFAYDIRDDVSGDSKSQIESRDGDVVRGQYTLLDADGLKRTVHYTADSINGFNAVVSRTPIAVVTPAQSLTVSHEPAIVKASFASPVISYSH